MPTVVEVRFKGNRREFYTWDRENPLKPGDPVVAAAAGQVLYTGTGIRGFGKLIVIRHDSGFSSVYAHNREILVKEGQAVSRGQRIAEMGDSDADRPKLHFEIRKSGKPVDPLRYLPEDRPS